MVTIAPEGPNPRPAPAIGPVEPGAPGSNCRRDPAPHGPARSSSARPAGHRGGVALALSLTTLACLLNLPVPLLVQGLVDTVAAAGRLDLLPAYALGLAAVFAGQALVGLLTTLVTAGIGLGVVRDLRHQLYA